MTWDFALCAALPPAISAPVDFVIADVFDARLRRGGLSPSATNIKVLTAIVVSTIAGKIPCGDAYCAEDCPAAADVVVAHVTVAADKSLLPIPVNKHIDGIVDLLNDGITSHSGESVSGSDPN